MLAGDGNKLGWGFSKNSNVNLRGKNLGDSLKGEPGLFHGGISWILFGEFFRRVKQSVLQQGDHPDDLGLKALSADDGIKCDFAGSSCDQLSLLGLYLV